LLGVGTISLTDGAWHQVVAVRDNSTNDNIIYVDGIEQGRSNHNYLVGFGSATAELNIGWLANTATGLYFNGSIDELALYNRALSPAEIQEHYAAGLLGNGIETLRPGPVADAGIDQTVAKMALVSLDGSLSADEDGTLSYQWQQTAGTLVSLSGASSVAASFTAPNITAPSESLTFELTVTDDDGQASSDFVNVTVSNTSGTSGGGGGGGGCFISTIFQK
jgi:VCBS repeat-containing protein